MAKQRNTPERRVMLADRRRDQLARGDRVVAERAARAARQKLLDERLAKEAAERKTPLERAGA